ncbi:MAG: diphthine--ammonia ligase [Thermoplasmata archaeon]|nr:diphthine--ammonia ligase [Thermoplasmata archaeon]
MQASGTECFCSWSGGKDSCLALHRSIKAGMRPSVLLTMLTDEGRRSRGHGLTVDVLKAQAASIGMRLVTKATSWDDYERNFLEEARKLRAEGVSVGVFGDIDLAQHRDWVEDVCSRANVDAELPLWNASRDELLEELVSQGFKAIMVSVKDGTLGKRWLGRTLDRNMIAVFKSSGIDPSGEAGEYHTCVVDGPLFSRSVRFENGDSTLRDGYWFLDLSVLEG